MTFATSCFTDHADFSANTSCLTRTQALTEADDLIASIQKPLILKRKKISKQKGRNVEVRKKTKWKKV